MEQQFLNPTPEKFESLMKWLNNHQSKGAERFEYEQPVRSVHEAIDVSGLEKADLIKSICLKHKKDDTFVVAIILAGSNVNKKMIREGVSSKKWSMATPEQIFNTLGFPAGGVPPVCLPNELDVYVDPRVVKREYVVGGGGTQASLMKLPPYLILEAGAEERIISIG